MRFIYRLVQFLSRYLNSSELEILYFRQIKLNEVEYDKRTRKIKQAAEKEMAQWLAYKGEAYKDEIYALKLSRPVPLSNSGITPPETSWEDFWGVKKNKI